MAPSFFNIKQLRRRSRASFRTEQSTDTSSEGSHNGRTPTTGSLTPPSVDQLSNPSLLNIPPPVPPNRPPLANNANPSNRRSVSGMTGIGSPAMGAGRAPSLPVSPFSPRIQNITDNSWVYQKILLVHGIIGDSSEKPMDGVVTVSRLDDGFPPQQWPVSGSHFKALVYMLPGANRIRFDFASPKLINSGSSNPIHASHYTWHMLPPTNAPPLHLAILLGKDSPGAFDAVPARIEHEGRGLETAIRKFRMAAYLWQAFTAEQMSRNRLGRRVFRFDEEWTPGSACYRDRETGQMRSEAKVHLVRTDKTVAELRDLNKAQQNPGADDSGALYGIAIDAMQKYFQPKPGQKLYISALIIDSHWDRQTGTITAHAALGGGAGGLQLGIFGSHCLQSYPTSFEEVVPAFTDCTVTDPQYLANDCNEAGSSWEAANIGIGAHLHETGHLLGLPHREHGVMLRDYVRLNRSFITREAYCVRTKSSGGLVLEADECTWHRLDCLHFRTHPCFRLPNDHLPPPDESIQAWPVDNGNIMITAASGVAFVEIYGENDDVCHTWLEYSPDPTATQRQVLLLEQEIRNRLPEEKRKGPIRLKIRSWGGGDHEIKDLKQLGSKQSAVKLGSRIAFVSGQLGTTPERGEASQVLFTSALRTERVLSRVIVYNGSAVDGIEFVYDDDSRQLFGKKGGKPGGDSFDMDVRRGEYISGFYVRAGAWIDGIQILTSLGRRSPVYGTALGGSGHTLIPPRGYSICGVSGFWNSWVHGFSVLITR